MQHQAVTMQHAVRALQGLLFAANETTTQLKMTIQLAHDILDELFFTRTARVNEVRVDIAERTESAGF